MVTLGSNCGKFHYNITVSVTKAKTLFLTCHSPQIVHGYIAFSMETSSAQSLANLLFLWLLCFYSYHPAEKSPSPPKKEPSPGRSNLRRKRPHFPEQF